jgi:squalene synthase HpnC
VTLRRPEQCKNNIAEYSCYFLDASKEPATVPADHYENFPVASILLPRHLRRPIEVIYAFARTADDFADEGERSQAERIRLLDEYDRELDLIDQGQRSARALFIDLGGVVRNHGLPLSLFHDLLDAFKQDVVKTRYETYAELIDYCRRSADPVGRLLLHLNGAVTEQNLAFSDAICTALQLINHWQDVAIDWQKNDGGRVYLPQEDLLKYGLSDADIAGASNSAAWQQMMYFQTGRARDLLWSGKPLTTVLGGRMGAELRLIVAGGACVLDKIDGAKGDVFRHRPNLNKWDWLKIVPRALLPI